MECLRCGGDHLSTKCPYFSTPNKLESTTYCKQCDRDPCECEARKMKQQERENEKKRRREMDDNDGPALKRRRMDTSERLAVDSKMDKLTKLMQKSGITISSESSDSLTPFIVYNDDVIIATHGAIFGAIKESQCLISEVDVVCDLITGFVVKDDEGFTTQQFLTLLTSGSNLRHPGLESFNNLLRYLDMDSGSTVKDMYLTENVVAKIDGQRKKLTLRNAKDMHGIQGGKGKGKWAWVKWMNGALGDCSIYKVPTCSLGNDMWEWSFCHFVVGRTEEGHIIGLCAEVVWT